MDEALAINAEDLDDELRVLVKPEPAPGERLLWASRGGRRYGAGGWAIGLLWASGLAGVSFVCFRLLVEPEFRKAEGFLAFVSIAAGVASFLAVLGTVSSALTRRASARKLRRAVYALTDSRANIWRPRSGSKGIEVMTYPRGRVPSVLSRRVPGRLRRRLVQWSTG